VPLAGTSEVCKKVIEALGSRESRAADVHVEKRGAQNTYPPSSAVPTLDHRHPAPTDTRYVLRITYESRALWEKPASAHDTLARNRALP
jgi:hypothetical protein